jgi:hypothetical protein
MTGHSTSPTDGCRVPWIAAQLQGRRPECEGAIPLSKPLSKRAGRAFPFFKPALDVPGLRFGRRLPLKKETP